MKTFEFTKEGLDKIKKEYEELLTVKRPAARNRLQLARSMGDLSENSEYVAAKEDLTFLEGTILELETIIKNAVVVEKTVGGKTIEVGLSMKVLVNGKEEIYSIVGEFEADPMNKKLSQTSPIGKALLGKKVGDVVEITVPAGTLSYKIVDIL